MYSNSDMVSVLTIMVVLGICLEEAMGFYNLKKALEKKDM